MITLEWRYHERAQQKTFSHRDEITIGRADNSAILLAEQEVSRRHASVNARNGQVVLTNHSQTNPIEMDTAGRRWHLTSGQQATLQEGARFRVGTVWFQVTLLEAEPQEGELFIKCPKCERLWSTSKYHECPIDGYVLATLENL